MTLELTRRILPIIIHFIILTSRFLPIIFGE